MSDTNVFKIRECHRVPLSALKEAQKGTKRKSGGKSPRNFVVAMAKKIITTLKGCNNLLLQSLNVVTLFGPKLLQPFSNCYNI